MRWKQWLLLSCLIACYSGTGSIGVVMLRRQNTTAMGFRVDQFQRTSTYVTSGNIMDGKKVQASIFVPEEATKQCTGILDRFISCNRPDGYFWFWFYSHKVLDNSFRKHELI